MSETKSNTDDKPTPARRVRDLMRGLDRATLSTAQRDAEGWPYGSMVMFATDASARPLLLISELADHTKNLHEDKRASLMFDGTAGLDEPLTGARATLLGTLSKCDDEGAKARYLRRHPNASFYAGFGDFSIWRMEVERAHIVAGFGDIHWLDGSEITIEAPHALTEAEASIVEHMNEDHGDANDLYANILLGLEGSGWQMTGCDREGADLRLGGKVARIAFDKPAEDAEEARRELVKLVKRARKQSEAG